MKSAAKDMIRIRMLDFIAPSVMNVRQEGGFGVIESKRNKVGPLTMNVSTVLYGIDCVYNSRASCEWLHDDHGDQSPRSREGVDKD